MISKQSLSARKGEVKFVRATLPLFGLDIWARINELRNDLDETTTELVKLSSVPSFLLAEWGSLHRRLDKPPIGHSFTVMILYGLDELQDEEEIQSWDEAVEKVHNARLTLRPRTILRSFMGTSRKPGFKFEPDIPCGQGENYVFRCPKKYRSKLNGRADELGVSISTLGIVALSKGLSTQHGIDKEARDAFNTTYSRFVTELGKRADDLLYQLEHWSG